MNPPLSKTDADRVSGAVFLIGLGLLFFTGFWWPGLLFVIGASSLARGMAEGRAWYGFQGGVWLIGLGIVFAFGFNLPLLLILIGLSMLFGYVFKPPFLGGQDAPAYDDDEVEKPKRDDETIYVDGEPLDTEDLMNFDNQLR